MARDKCWLDDSIATRSLLGYMCMLRWLQIPVHPLGYGDAQKLMENLQGSTPDNWKGGMTIAYKVGPGPSKVNMGVYWCGDECFHESRPICHPYCWCFLHAALQSLAWALQRDL